MFLPGESQGRGSLVGRLLWGRTESDMWELLLPLVSPTAQTLSGSEAGQRPALCQSFLRCRMRCSLQVQKPNPPLQVGLRLPQTQRMAQAGNVKEEERCRQVLGS